MRVNSLCGRVITPTKVVVHNAPLERDMFGPVHDIRVECTAIGQEGKFLLMECEIPLPGSPRYRKHHTTELGEALNTARGLMRQYGGRWVERKAMIPA